MKKIRVSNWCPINNFWSNYKKNVSKENWQKKNITILLLIPIEVCFKLQKTISNFILAFHTAPESYTFNIEM